MVIQIPCEQVVRETSNYLDQEITAELRQRMDHHFHGCQRCSAVLDGTRNVVALIGDERSFSIPPGFGERLYSRLRANLGG
jgi:hypothetical protein